MQPISSSLPKPASKSGENGLSSLILAAAAGIALMFPVEAIANDYPSKPISLVVPFVPGGSSDAFARQYAVQLQESLGQSVIVENRGGASGAIGAGYVAQAPADGYTILLAHPTGITILPLLNDELGYSGIEDFAPVGLLGATPQVLVVHPSLPETLEEFVAQAKAQPGELNYSSGGIATPPHLAGELFKLRADVDIAHVPFNGSPASITNLLGGHVDAAIQNVDSLLPHLESGALRGLAVASEERSVHLPDLPTFSELGIDGVVNRTWFGIVAPAGVPADVIEKLEAATSDIARSEEFQAFLAHHAADPAPLNGAEFSAFLEEENARWEEVLQAANITLE